MAAAPELRSFFKVYFPEKSAEHLELPRAFCLKAKGPPLGPAFLRGPSGNVWKVEVVEHEGCRFFGGAWPAFVKDHSLQVGEFLVFEWDGRSSYDVIILDYSTCDKPSAFLASPSTVDDHSGVEHDEVTAEGEKVIDAFGAPTPGNEELGVKTPRSGPGRPRKHSLGTEQSTYTDGVFKGRKIYLSQRRPVQKEEIDRAHKAAYSFRSINPFVVIIMRKSAVYTGYMLNFPSHFVKYHLSSAPEELVLRDNEGRHWPVSLVSAKNGFFMSAGWRKFCIENHLEEYDACVFELIDPKMFLVHIFRVVEEITQPLVQTIRM